MPLTKSCSKAARSKNIAELIRSGRDRKQAVAISFQVCRDLKKKKKK